MELSAISNNSLDIESLINGTNRTNNGNNIKTQTAEYAKKGEPMYMADMDSDEDGTVTLDEYREYCKSKGINTKDMMKMSQLASAYRTMKAENEAIDYISKLKPNVFPKLKQANSESNHVKNNDNKFNISADANSEKKVSYKDYMEFCEQNSKVSEIKSNTKIEETDNGKFKISNAGKALKSYNTSEKHALKSTFEKEV